MGSRVGAGTFFARTAPAIRYTSAVRLILGILLVCGAAVLARAQGFIPESEAMYPPTRDRLEKILAAAAREGWAPQSASLHAIARTAYERDRLAAAAAWLHVYRWSVLFGASEREYTPRWVQAVNQAQVGHANMPRTYSTSSSPLGLRLTPACQAWLVENAAFSDEFFALIQPVDYLPNVFQILSDLYQADPRRFATYANLALAIAVVYDVPPPPNWPHAQVTAQALPRRWPKPLDAFLWWTGEDRAGHTYQPLTRLGAEELKFVVDAAASFDDLAWSQQIVNYPLAKFERVYSIVHYRTDRNAVNGAVWPGAHYSLPQILGQGGICVDQAYFAAEAGKARGVPTLLFVGAGNDARHAWFGYLDEHQHWQLDAGRYAEQRFVTGFARDPQTWRAISDHELKFLAERFHALPSYEQSQIHAEFAADYLLGGDAAAAAKAARKAVDYEGRNQTGWETLLMAEKAADYPAKRIEGTLYEAIHAFARYPDLETYYSDRLCQSLRARGETSAADNEQQRIAHKYRGDRSDLSVQEARDILLRSLATQPLHEQVRTYNAVVDNYGRKAGILFFDQIVVTFVQHLAHLGQRREALAALDRASGVLKSGQDSQLDQEFARVRQMVVSK